MVILETTTAVLVTKFKIRILTDISTKLKINIIFLILWEYQLPINYQDQEHNGHSGFKLLTLELIILNGWS